MDTPHSFSPPRLQRSGSVRTNIKVSPLPTPQVTEPPPPEPTLDRTRTRAASIRPKGEGRRAVEFSTKALSEALSSIGGEENPSEIPVYQFSFSEPDSPSVITFLENGQIKGCTFTKLIERLTGSHDTLDMDDILLTYRSFCKPTDLAEALYCRYHTAGFGDDSKSVKLRVLNVVRKWVEKYWYDCANEDGVHAILLKFLGSIKEGAAGASAAATVKTKLLANIELRETPIIGGQYGGGHVLSSVNIFSYPLLEIAKQLTLIEWSIWVDIKQWELLGLAWTKPEKRERAPNVVAMTERFNLVSNWVVSKLCCCETLKSRVKIFEGFVMIADYLRQLGNFNGMMEICSAFQRGPIARMKKTYAAVMTPKVSKMFKDLEFLTDQTKNYSNLRNAIKNVNPPVIPYLGMYLTDLLFLDEGNPDYLLSAGIAPPGLINFSKSRQCSEIIKRVKQYQLLGYQANCPVVPELMGALKNNLKIIDDDTTLYELSNYLEPRGGGEPGPRPQHLNQYFNETEKSKTKLKLGDIAKKLQLAPSEEIKKEAFIDPETGDLLQATIPKIIAYLTSARGDGGNLVLPFLAMYRTWATPEEILQFVIARFSVPEPKGAPLEELKKFYMEVAQPIQLRVANVIKLWLTYYWKDFEDCPDLLRSLKGFIDQQDSSFTVGINLQALLGPTITKKSSPVAAVSPPASFIPSSSFDIRDDSIVPLDALNPVEVARQMNLESHKMILAGFSITELSRETDDAFALLRLTDIESNSADFETIVDMIQNKIVGVQGFDIQDRKKTFGKIYKECFIANEAVLWFSQRLQVPTDIAVKYGKLLHSKNIIENLTTDSEFLNNDQLWKFVNTQTQHQPEMKVFNFTASVHITRTRANVLSHLAWIKRFVCQEINHSKAISSTPWTTLHNFIHVAQELKTLNDWHSLLGLVGGLQQLLTSENKFMWDNLPQQDRLWFISTRAIFLDPTEFKKTIVSLPSGSIPCMQVFLDAVVSTRTIFEDPVNSRTGLINVVRMAEIGRIIDQFAKIHTKVPPVVTPVPAIQAYLAFSRGTTRK